MLAKTLSLAWRQFSGCTFAGGTEVDDGEALRRIEAPSIAEHPLR